VRWVRLDGRPVRPAAARITTDDPLVRAGDGLIETMRARRGRIVRRAAHLDRMEASAAALDLPVPPRARWERELDALLAAAGDGDLRVRLCVSAAPTLWVEAVPVDPLPVPPVPLRAVALEGTWLPDDRLAEHKTASRARWEHALRRARAAGADTALMLDMHGRLGESPVASVLVHVDGAWATAPVRGLLPGVGRAAVMELVPVRERLLERDAWSAARELALVSALGGVRPVVGVDGRPVGTGAPGPAAAALAGAYRDLVDRETSR